MLDGPRLQDVSIPFESKDLLNALPVLAKPVIEIRTTGDVTVLKPPMPFVPRLGLLPPAAIGDHATVPARHTSELQAPR